MTTSDRRTSRLSALAVVAALVVLATVGSACSSTTDEDANGNADATIDEDTSSGAVMNVLDASTQAEGAVVTVQGFLIDDTGTLYIADLIAESFPPQPGGPTLEVEGLDLDRFDGVSEEGPIRWRDEPATITATLKSGKLVNATRADG